MARHVMRRFGVGILLVAATLLLRTSTMDANHYGHCYPNEWGCNYTEGGYAFCFDQYTCLQPNPEGPVYACLCDGNALCDWVESAC
jgi:hypothetical protein